MEKIVFNKKYFILFIIFFCIEVVFIFVETNVFIRSYATDMFAVMYLYFFIRTISSLSVFRIITVVYIISYLIETIQYFEIFTEENQNFLMELVFGATFDFWDLVAYNFGLGISLIIEYFIENKNTS